MSDDRYAIRLSGDGTAESPYALVVAYEVEDDGELEFEDDFFKRQLTFEGDPGAGTFRVIAQELSYNGSAEVKTYRQIETAEIGGLEYVVMIRESEYVVGGYDDSDDYGSGDDDSYRGRSKSEDVYYGLSGSDRIDCRGVFGKKAGVYYDTALGGEDSDEYVIGKNANSCYYDDKRRGRETFLYCDDFDSNDKFLFLKPFKSRSRYELRDVEGTSYAAKLAGIGLNDVDKVLVNKKDSRDILACLNFDDSFVPPTSGWGVADVLG